MRRRDERASDSVMLFMRGGVGVGVSVEEAPVSRCKVPLQEIIHGGFGLKGVKVFVCRTSHSHPRRECVLPRSLSIPRQGSTGSEMFAIQPCLTVRGVVQSHKHFFSFLLELQQPEEHKFLVLIIF